jgi:uncharacterized protein (TIGR03435 family)
VRRDTRPGQVARFHAMPENMSMKNFTMFLGLIVSINRAVIDRTGLTERYDVKLRTCR